MENIVQRSIPPLLTQAGEIAHGVGLHGATIPLVLHSKASIEAAVEATTAKILAYGQAKDELTNRREVVRTKAEAVSAFLTLGRDLLKAEFGTTHNQSWAVTGFATSLKIPRSQGPLLARMGLFKEFIAAYPIHELPAKSITAVNAETLHDELDAARGAVMAQETIAKDRLEERNAQVELLRKQLAEVIGEMGMKVPPMDNRWLTFGLNRPGQKVRPDAPTNVTAAGIGNNSALVKWDAAPRADHYRIWIKINGVPAEFDSAGNSADLDFILEGLPSKAMVEIAVSAVNNGGESSKSTLFSLQTV